MQRNGFIIDIGSHSILRNCTYDDKRVEDLYHKVDGKDLIPIAYIFPEESRKEVEHLLLTLKEAKTRYESITADIFYKRFPKLR